MAITTIIPLAKKTGTSFTTNGFSTDTTPNGVPFPLQFGVPFQSNYTFKVVPAIVVDTCVSSEQTTPDGSVNGSVYNVTLNSENTTDPDDDTQIVTKAYTVNNALGGTGGQTGVLMDCERSLTITIGENPTVEAVTLFMTGLDYRGVPKQATFGFPDLSENVGQPTDLRVTFSLITSLQLSTGIGTTVSFGNGRYIGLPYLLPNLSFVNSLYWSNSPLTVNSTNVNVGNIWRVQENIPLSNPDASTVESIPRGRILLPEDSDGSTVLAANYFVYGSDAEMNTELLYENQSTLNIVQVQGNASGQSITPYLVEYDLVGMTYPGDLVAATAYNALFSN